MLRSFILSLFCVSLSLAQSTVDPLRPPMPGTLFLRVQLPASDTVKTFSSHYRIAACTTPEAKAFINGKETKVYASGAFVGFINVPIGASSMRLTVKNANGDSLWREFVLLRPAPMKNSPHDTLVIEQAMMEPSDDLWLATGDVLEVKFKGSPGWEARFDIPDVESGIPMHELPASEAGGFSGVYAGRYTVKPTDEVRDVPMIFHLKKSFWHSEQCSSAAKISFFPKELPRVAELMGKRPYLNYGLGTDRLGGSKLGFLEAGVRVVINGKVGSQYRVRLSEAMTAWLPEENAKLLPPETPLPHSLAGAITAIGSGSYDIVSLALDDQLAYSSEQLINPNVLAVDVYGATSNTNWIARQLSTKGIENITWQQVTADQYRLLIALNHPHWGHSIEYSGTTLKIKIRRPPVFASQDSVLAGLTIAVDAGHGGDNHGAIGATGVFEKDVTMNIVRHLENVLKAKAANVVLTRTETDAPPTGERIEGMLDSNAQLLVSVHCNSAGEASDPLMLRGVSTYYRFAGYHMLADDVYDKMLAIGLKQFGVIGGFNFVLNSLTQMPNVLVETAFLSNPEDEMLLLDDAFRQKIAEQIAAGLEEYVRANGLNRKF
ncbi:MAG TPA: N-acetylmuramoyl-L-alanine amidase [Bacteroidota bacterium]|nr:N-acetylmuramoyl-L-alanine amidase [Bacteroidota bacterium]